MEKRNDLITICPLSMISGNPTPCVKAGVVIGEDVEHAKCYVCPPISLSKMSNISRLVDAYDLGDTVPLNVRVVGRVR